MDIISPQDDPQKWCSGCKRFLSLALFHKSKGERDGLKSQCRTCRSIQRKAHYEQNKEQYATKARRRYQQDTERHKARSKAWHERNRDKHNALTMSYYLANKELWRKRSRQWYKDHPEALAASHSKRRALKRNNGGSFTAKEWQLLKIYYNHTCLRCKRIEPTIELTADHVLPLVLGGPSYIWNIQPLCRSCNSWKGNKHIDYRDETRDE